MMQFSTETLPHHTVHQRSPSPVIPSMSKSTQSLTRARPWPGFSTTSKGTLGSFGDANCMEQLLVHCANAIESNDATLAQQILWVLNNIAPPDGDSNQRLACAFLRALIVRAAKRGTCKMLAAMAANARCTNLAIDTHRFSIIELAGFVDLTPWHRFGFTAANAAILEAVEGYSVVHIVDLSLTHCMQIPTLIDAISSRLETPPVIKLTVVGSTEELPPMLDLCYEQLGSKLVTFARSRNVMLEFRVIPSSCSDGFSNLIEKFRLENWVSSTIQNGTEALIINSHMMLHYVPEETSNPNNYSPRNMFLKELRSLDPTAVVIIDEDADLTSNNLEQRMRSAFNYLWIPFDTVDTFLPKGSKQRQWYEADVCWKIENVIAQEGVARVERLEPRGRWAQRMRTAGFRGVGFGQEAVAEVKTMLEEHAAGWGLKKEEDGLVLTWKGHNVVFATVWVPS